MHLHMCQECVATCSPEAQPRGVELHTSGLLSITHTPLCCILLTVFHTSLIMNIIGQGGGATITTVPLVMPLYNTLFSANQIYYR